MKKQMLFVASLISAIAIISGCTKTRKAELPESQQASVFAISEFGETAETSSYKVAGQSQQANLQGPDSDNKNLLSMNDVSVPNRLKYMFNQLPLNRQSSSQFEVTFGVDKEYVTAYKIAKNLAELSVLETSISYTLREVQLMARNTKNPAARPQSFNNDRRAAVQEKQDIQSGRKAGVLLVPLFKYKIESYGTLARTKNDLKEETSRLELKSTEWKDATHIQISSHTESRQVIGDNISQSRQLKQIYSENEINNQQMSAADLQARLSVGMRFIDANAQVFTRLDADLMRVYELTQVSQLNESQLRLLRNRAGNQEILSCQDEAVRSFIQNPSADCVLVLKANIPVSYKTARLTELEEGIAGSTIEFETVDRSRSVGLIEIQENVAAAQVDISGALDPDSTIKLADIRGEFFYRRTFESASNMFLGRTGTSGDMAIVRFELEDSRIVIRNQQSLIKYTGQGAKDREELMSFPVKYIRIEKADARGAQLTIPKPVETTKEKAEYAVIDWTRNTVPDSTSPLAFYAGGSCFAATSSLRVTDTDMRLATDGVLNYSLSGSYTVRPDLSCVPVKDVNSAYWGGSYQFNFNVVERISFMKHTKPESDVQFTSNISHMAQAAFNFGVFTLADRVTDNGALLNRDGSEKYMPILHDFRNGKKLKYYVGGLNNPAVTNPERRELIISATRQVVDEWNRTLRYAFRGTPLERAGDYVEIVIDEGENTGHLGDLDRNYIWFQELIAENGLLGVAQPAANPRSGTIQAANVIVYSGNTFNQTETLLKINQISRAYEKQLAKESADLQALAIQEDDVIFSSDVDEDAPASSGNMSSSQVSTSQAGRQILSPLLTSRLTSESLKLALDGVKTPQGQANFSRIVSRDLLRNSVRPQKIEYAINNQTFLKKLTEIAANKKSAHPYELELEVNKAFIQFGNLDEGTKQLLSRRSEMLDAAIKFDNNSKNRPGCFLYSRTDINDAALVLDKDPHKNLMLNFKKNIMSTLSHELGHAFGLMHNFKASTDKANYEFSEDKNKPTGRNYSSIMDYIADIDMHYAGPGPYDAHAVRAAYTGLVEIAPAALNDTQFKALKPQVGPRNLVSIDDLSKVMALKQNRPATSASFVHLTKDSINTLGLIKYYEQCDDMGVGSSALCTRFDSGGSAQEIVQNLIQDYNRGYINRNYVHDKIIFGGSQKVQVITRNISLFQNMRAFLDEAVINYINGSGLPAAQHQQQFMDQLLAAYKGYQFFHELIRTPDASGLSVMPERKSNGEFGLNQRLVAIPYTYKDEEEKEVKAARVLEARSLHDVKMSRDKIDTVGIAYDKIFSMLFLMQSTAAPNALDSQSSNISYINFEQWFLGISDPSDSLTINTVLSVLMNDLKVGFFSSGGFQNTSIPVQVTRDLSQQTALSTVIGLAEAKWSALDPFSDMFKMARAPLASAPKDRYNSVKPGQDRSLSDTRVYFAAQNAWGSSVIVTAAARNEFYMANREAIWTSLNEVMLADSKYRQQINRLIGAECKDGFNSARCVAAREKPAEQYLRENPTIAADKTAADSRATTFVLQLKELNTDGLILSKRLDADDSQVNIRRQVEMVRAVLAQTDQILEVKAILEATPAAQVNAQVAALRANLAGFKNRNEQLVRLHLVSSTYDFLYKSTEEIEVKLNGQNPKSLSEIVSWMMPVNKIENDLSHQQDVIEKLSIFSSAVDSDMVSN